MMDNTTNNKKKRYWCLDAVGTEDRLRKNMTPELEAALRQRDIETNAVYLSTERKQEIKRLGASMGVENYDTLFRILIDCFDKYGMEFMALEKERKKKKMQ